MRAEQIRVSHNVRFFGDRMIRKYGLRMYDDPDKPVVVYGIYNGDDITFFETFKPEIIALWRGTDAKVLNEGKVKRLGVKKNVKHYAASPCVQRTLAKWGIKSQFLPITSTDANIKREPRGDCVYCYVASKTDVMRARYRVDMLKQLERDLRVKFLYTTLYQFPFEKLIEVYKRCFVGVRLLGHDGLSNSILEMGLMGRRTVSNSGLPYTIPWKTYDDVRTALIEEWKNHKNDNTEISKAYQKLINIGDAWLEI